MLRLPSVRVALAALTLVVSVSGCDCGKVIVDGTVGDLGVIWRDGAGERVISRDAVYDFGAALVGERKPLTMTVQNNGVGKLTVTTLEQTEGAEVAIGAGTATSDFEIEFIPVDLFPSGRAEYAMHFTPKSLSGAFEAKLKLSSEGTRLEDSTAVITLRGTAERGACEFPRVIDFGKVPVGDTLSSTLAFNNPTAVDAAGFVGELMGAESTLFGVTPRGDLPVASMSSANVTFTFSPTELRVSEATVVVRGAGGCPDTTITVRGEGSGAVLTWAPMQLVYGHVTPGAEKVMEVLFSNTSNVPITLTELNSLAPGDFYVVPGAGQDPATFTVPGGGAPTPLRIACNPATLGNRDSSLTFKTPLRSLAMGTIPLKCTGGGPRIRATPSPTLAFGRVAYFAGGTASVSRKVNVQNVGTAPPMPDLTANLFLGQLAPDGTVGQVPLFEVIPGAGTAAGEFVVSLGSPYDPAVGLVAVAGRNFVDLAVTLLPQSLGMKQAELIIHSNDPLTPEVRITLTANAVQLPPCDIQVSPAMANFGLVTPPNTKDLPITITNRLSGANDVCYITGLDLAAGSATAYSIVGGPVVEKELQPSEAWTVVVRVAPPGPVPTSLITLTGELTFNIASPTAPRVGVPLRTSVGPACVAITPDPLDFGTVKVGCNSSTRTVNVYNVCSTPVTINDFSIPSAGGLLPGSAGCPGTTACPEFFLVSAPTIPTGGLTLAPGAAPLQVQLRYLPLDVGSDTGALSVDVVQSGQSLSYLLGIQGSADTTGMQVDTFRQSMTPKADILLVVDDSCSMGDKQMSLASNFASFIQYANATNTDYQIGVVTTTEDNQPCVPFVPCIPGAGKLVVRNGVGPILTRNTPNLSSAFSTLVNVGTDGSGEENGLATATLALTPPLSAGGNAGFLRVDANLAVVVISDAGDQSAQPVSYYQNRLINVKGFNRLSMFTFSTIGPFLPMAPAGCTYDGGGDPLRYSALVSFTSGVSDEICNASWATTLQNLGRTAFGYRTQFFLNNSPDLAAQPLVVKINGVAVPGTGWTYDSASNSVIFTATTTPGAGETLTVEYATVCF
ncbi:MAG: VWA domain-containing protein [Archangium sp.]|nr:VWA domain-containing protein [Archangium sp.]MDP3572480.1 VWA domain-containing protein [Archangium sp.]